ncbi:predicted protein [Streptomyces albidoflavus]|uniref:Uncharacterized protein n=1 Tax=Streptomyces albidoflavus TaxID=1886 RepID=A0AA37FB59_9ACTN|nr:predicted protein [Streptomyces albidoflavus]BDH49334.1 hypothetical protein MTP02_03450 [Streptomyces albus]GHI44404.1 hypothetical protein ScoT_05780 [Streptomyces albidoflavus]
MGPGGSDEPRVVVAGAASASRCRGSLTRKIHLVGEGGCRPTTLLLTPGQWSDAQQMVEALGRIPEPKDQPAKKVSRLPTAPTRLPSPAVDRLGRCGRRT